MPNEKTKRYLAFEPYINKITTFKGTFKRYGKNSLSLERTVLFEDLKTKNTLIAKHIWITSKDIPSHILSGTTCYITCKPTKRLRPGEDLYDPQRLDIKIEGIIKIKILHKRKGK